MAFSFRILAVDLTRAQTETRLVVEDDLRAYLGGAGQAARMLYPALRPELDPLSPEASLLFLTGPLTGTLGPAVGRFVICAMSPATHSWGESNVGGFFGPELRAAGYDGLMITGRSAEPVYLWIHDGVAEIRPADHLWGACDTYQTQERIRETLGDPRVRVASM
jgi:aldehyde:ferredoxin oxidoreductase